MDALTIELLAELPHFRGLEPALLERVRRCTRLCTLERGNVLFERGDPARAFYVVLSGTIRLYRRDPSGREHALHTIGRRRGFAEAALLHFGRYPASARALEPTRLVEVGEGFLQLLELEPRLARSIIAALSIALHQLTERVEVLSFGEAGARLACFLVGLKTCADAPDTVLLPGAKKDVAEHLGMAPETLSRVLGRWRRRGWIEETHGRLRILRLDVLERLGQESDEEDAQA